MRPFRNIIYLCVLFLLFSCTKEKQKESYIQSNLPELSQLEKKDIEKFKKTMQLNSEGKLINWDNELLQKAYKKEEKYINILTYLINESGGNPDEIIITDNKNNKKVFYPSFYDVNNVKYSLSEIKNWNALFYVTTINCGKCVSNFKKMNDFALSNKDKKLKFVAIFENLKNIENYKKGDIFKTEGFLNDKWIILPKQNLLYLLTSKYNDTLGFPFTFIRKNGQDLKIYSNSSDVGDVEKFIIDNF